MENEGCVNYEDFEEIESEEVNQDELCEQEIHDIVIKFGELECQNCGKFIVI